MEAFEIGMEFYRPGWYDKNIIIKNESKYKSKLGDPQWVDQDGNIWDPKQFFECTQEELDEDKAFMDTFSYMQYLEKYPERREKYPIIVTKRKKYKRLKLTL